MFCPVCGKKMFFRVADVGWTQHYLCTDKECRAYIIETGCESIVEKSEVGYTYYNLTEREYKEAVPLYINETLYKTSLNNKINFIAKIRYLGWICYQMGANLPLHDVSDDYEISEERLDSLKKGTAFALMHPYFTVEENHSLWMEGKREQGYTYGEVLDTNKKTHPSMVPFDELTEVEQRKDSMDILMVKLAEKLYEELFYN